MKRTVRLTLNSRKFGSQTTVEGVHVGDDNSCELIITVTDGNKILDLSSETTVATMCGTKPDGTTISRPCSIVNNNIVYTLEKQDTAVSGNVLYQVTVTSDNGISQSIIATAKFTVAVMKNIYIPIYRVLESEPSDWSTNYRVYYRLLNNKYTAISDSSCPAFLKDTFYYLVNPNFNSKDDYGAFQSALVRVENLIGRASDILTILDKKINDNEAEHICNKVSAVDFRNLSATDYPNIKALNNYHTNYVEPCYDDINNLEDSKADKATTLAGYGITDTYTKNEVDTALATKPSFDDVYTVEEADDHFLSKYDAGNTYATKAELVTKANKETTYTKDEVDSLISKSTYEFAVGGGYTGTAEDLSSALASLGIESENNLFSFDNADDNLASFSVNQASNGYIYKQNSTIGYKDTSEKKFVFYGDASGVRHGITGGLPVLQSGVYMLSAELYIPSGNTERTKLAFGMWSFPNAVSNDYQNMQEYDLLTQDTWVKVEKTVTIAEGDTHQYIGAQSQLEKYPFYMRNIKVVSLDVTEEDLNSLCGKKWAVIGDSLTAINSFTTKHYFDYIAEKTGIELYNMGLDGSGYKRKFDSDEAFYQRILNVPEDTDVVTIFGSGNDVNAEFLETAEIGEVTDTGTDTICGCINTAIDNFYSILPTVPLGVITPTPWFNHNPADTTDSMSIYCEKLVEICKRKGVPCLDLYHCSSLRPWDEDYRALAYSKDTMNGLHPDETGHKIIASRIMAFLQSLVI